jgi:pimeloyl-ACP methyl ester carboxylesterase
MLAPDISSLAYDLRGHGRSTRSPSVDYSLDAHVADLRAVLDASGTRKAILVAHRSSCAVAAEFARRMPERVLALVFVAPTSPRTATELPGALGQFREAIFTRYRTDLSGLLYADFAGNKDGEITLTNRIVSDLRATPPDVVASTLASVGTLDVSKAVAVFPGRTFVIIPGLYSRLPVFQPFPIWQPAAGADSARVSAARAPDLDDWAPVLEPSALAKRLRGVIAGLGAGERH